MKNLMKAVLIGFLVVAGGVIGETLTTIGMIDRPSFISPIDLTKVDFRTNTVPAKVWMELSTNTTVTQRPVFAIHAIYPSCQCDSCTGKLWDETTRVFLSEVAELKGKRVTLDSNLVWETNRIFNPLDSTTRIYR